MFEKLGVLPWLDWVFSLLPTDFWGVRIPQYGIGLFVTWGVLYTLALVVENRWFRITRQYRSVKIGDVALTVSIGVGLAIVSLLPDSEWLWYRDSWAYYWFHYGLLAAGAIGSFMLKWKEVRESRIKCKIYYRIYRQPAPTTWLNQYHSSLDLTNEIRAAVGYDGDTYAERLARSLQYGVAYSRRQLWSATAIGHMLLLPVVVYLTGLVVTAAITKIIASGLAVEPFFWGGISVWASLVMLTTLATRRLGVPLKVVAYVIALLTLLLCTASVYKQGEQRPYWFAVATFVMVAGIVVWAWMGKLDNTRKRPDLKYVHPDEFPFPFVWKPIRAIVRWMKSFRSSPHDGQLGHYAERPDGPTGPQGYGSVPLSESPDVEPEPEDDSTCHRPTFGRRVIDTDPPREGALPESSRTDNRGGDMSYTSPQQSAQSVLAPVGTYGPDGRLLGDTRRQGMQEPELAPVSAPAPEVTVEEPALQTSAWEPNRITPGGVELLNRDETRGVQQSVIDAVDPRKRGAQGVGDVKPSAPEQPAQRAPGLRLGEPLPPAPAADQVTSTSDSGNHRAPGLRLSGSGDAGSERRGQPSLKTEPAGSGAVRAPGLRLGEPLPPAPAADQVTSSDTTDATGSHRAPGLRLGDS